MDSLSSIGLDEDLLQGQRYSRMNNRTRIIASSHHVDVVHYNRSTECRAQRRKVLTGSTECEMLKWRDSGQFARCVFPVFPSRRQLVCVLCDLWLSFDDPRFATSMKNTQFGQSGPNANGPSEF